MCLHHERIRIFYIYTYNPPHFGTGQSVVSPPKLLPLDVIDAGVVRFACLIPLLPDRGWPSQFTTVSSTTMRKAIPATLRRSPIPWNAL